MKTKTCGERSLIILLALCIITLNCFSQNWSWAKSAPGNSLDEANSVATDLQGNIYITGRFSSLSVNFAPHPITGGATNGDDIFLAKYDPSGNVLWAKGIGDDGNEAAYSVATDPQGNVFITGYFSSSTISFEAFVLNNTAAYSFFLTKYNSSGVVQWATSAGAAQSYDVATDASGNVFITGYFYLPTITFGAYTLNNTWGFDLFLTKYDAAGTVQWAKNMPTNSRSIATDASGNVYMAGVFDFPYTSFGTYTLTSAGFQDIFLTKFDASGNVLWARRAGGTADDEAKSIATNAFGNVYVTGFYKSPIASFGSYTLTNTINNGVSQDVFLAKYDASGNVKWAKSAGSAGQDIGWGAATDAFGNVYIAGNFSTVNGTASYSVTFGSSFSLACPAGAYDPLYIAKYDSTGNILCISATASGGGEASGSFGAGDPVGLATDPLGNAYIGGDFYWITNPLVIGTYTLQTHPTGPENIFVAKYTCINANDSVWPGDANLDLTANNFDLLNIGIGYGTTGTLRAGANNNWVGQASATWTNTFVSGINYKHADCNGDGTINNDDTLAVSLNYGLTHFKKDGTPDATSTDPDLYVSFTNDSILASTTFTVSLYLGTVSVTASNIYGGAFSVNYDPNFVEAAGSAHISFNNSWLGTPDTDMISLQKDFPTDGRLEVGVTRTDHQNVSGFGKIGTLTFTMKTAVTGKVMVSLSNTLFISNNETVVPVNLKPDSAIVYINVNGIKIGELNSLIKAYPNPADDKLTVDFAAIDVSEVKMINAMGQVVYYSPNKLNNQIQIDIKNFQMGMYYLSINTKEGLVVKRISVMNK